MKNGKLVQILATLSQVEMTRLYKYIQSPYFHVHQDTVRLFEILHKHHPVFRESAMEPEVVFHQLFPEAAYHKSRLYTLTSYLLKLTYDFLADQSSSAYYSQKKKRDLVLALTERGLTKIAGKVLQQMEKELENYTYRENRYYFEAFQYASTQADFELGILNRVRTPILQSVSDGLDHYYLVEKLKYACAMINHQKILSVAYQYPLLEEVIEYCQQLNFDEVPLIGVYYLTLQMQRSADGDSYYYQLTQLMDQYKPLFPDDEAINLYSLAINYCNRRYKSGAEIFLREMFELFRQMLRQSLVFANASTSMIYYKNIVSLGLKLKEYEWTTQFIHQYQDELPQVHQESMLQYSLALVAFEQEAYRQCTRHLLQVDFMDEFNRLNYYLLLMKTYFETAEVESLFSLCNTTLTYIRRNKTLAPNNRKAYINFVKFVQKMARILYNGSKDQPQLWEDIESSPLLVERKWLLSKQPAFTTQSERHV